VTFALIDGSQRKRLQKWKEGRAVPCTCSSQHIGISVGTSWFWRCSCECQCDILPLPLAAMHNMCLARADTCRRRSCARLGRSMEACLGMPNHTRFTIIHKPQLNSQTEFEMLHQVSRMKRFECRSV
jgi:hypothetical protein